MEPRMRVPATDTASSATDQSDASSAASNSACANASVAIASFPQQKCLTPTLHNVLDLLSAFVDCSDLLKSGMLAVGRKHKNTFSLAKNSYVWIVRHKNYLTAA